MLNRLGGAITAGLLHEKAQESPITAETPLGAPSVVEVEPKANFSTTMSQVSAPYNKYSSIIDTNTSFKPAKKESLYEQVFGRQATYFETLKESFLTKQA